MKQKIVIRVSMKDKKSRSKAMQIAFRFSKVEKAAIEGSGKDQIEVTGDGVDSVALAMSLRKQFGSAELLSVSSMDEKKPEPSKAQSEIQYWHHGFWGGGVAAPPHFYYSPDPYDGNSYCSIL